MYEAYYEVDHKVDHEANDECSNTYLLEDIEDILQKVKARC